MIASLLGLTNVVEDFLSEGAEVNAHSGGHGSALYAASEGGHSQIIQMLLDKGRTLTLKVVDITMRWRQRHQEVMIE